MTMPGTRTSREIVRESRFRIETSSAVECSRSWCGGRSIFLSWGNTIRCVHFRSALSNWMHCPVRQIHSGRARVVVRTNGMISAGSVTRRCANSSLYLIRSPMLMSQ